MVAGVIDGDRTVHARSADGLLEIVRYDRAGRWYLEQVNRSSIRERLTVSGAVEYALDFEATGGKILVSKPGGGQFDAKVRGARAKRARHR